MKNLAAVAMTVVLSACQMTASHDGRVFELLAGRWDVANQFGKCGINPHTITFSTDHRVMLLKYKHPVDSELGPILEARYDVLGYADNTVRVRLVQPAEARIDVAGAIVTWDLGLVGLRTYVWHRTDWPRNEFTVQRIKC